MAAEYHRQPILSIPDLSPLFPHGILLASSSLAIGGLCTTLEVGQYGLVINALLVLTLEAGAKGSGRRKGVGSRFTNESR
jgi:hypothetical protein